MQLTSASHSAYALDLFGFGDTTHEPPSYSLEHQAGLVEGFLEEMGIGRIALIGHGLGALVGLCIAGRQPSRVARMMALALPLHPMSLDNHLRSSSPAELRELLGGRSADAVALPDASTIDPRALDIAVDAGQIHTALAALRDAAVPCLLVYGANDPLLKPPSPEHTQAFGGNFHQVVLEDSGHYPMFDVPDAFHRLLVDFLAMDPGASPRGLQPKEEWRRRVR
jgi:pimeloyl-ACP methyl ester carboxylesterase